MRAKNRYMLTAFQCVFSANEINRGNSASDAAIDDDGQWLEIIFFPERLCGRRQRRFSPFSGFPRRSSAPVPPRWQDAVKPSPSGVIALREKLFQTSPRSDHSLTGKHPRLDFFLFSMWHSGHYYSMVKLCLIGKSNLGIIFSWTVAFS